MFSSLTALAAHPMACGGWGWGFGPWFLLVPLFWIGIIALFLTIGSRRRRAYWAETGGWGPRGGSQGARAVLAERYARGEIDEAEFRARLEVLLATSPQPRS